MAAEYEVVVEIPRGSRNKYEYDHERGVIVLDRQLFTATHFPVDYGFIPDTLTDDGDPLDALVIVEEPTFPGCHIICRSLGVLCMRDENGQDFKILSVPAHDPRALWADLSDVPQHLCDEISHFFVVYKDLEPGKHTEVTGWRDHAAADAEVARARELRRTSDVR